MTRSISSSTTASPEPGFRSGAVARMAGMPVATLRIWEQRHRAVRPATAPSGHRLYSSADVRRVMLLRRLTEQGHAIGSIAELDTERLLELADAMPGAAAAASVAAGSAQAPTSRSAPLRMVVIGRALVARLQRPAIARRLARPVQVVASFDSPAEAAGHPTASDIDLLVWLSPELPPSVPLEFEAARGAWRARRVAVIQRFSGTAARLAFAGGGAIVVREPPDDDALGAWLATLDASLGARGVEPSARVDAPPAMPDPTSGAAPPRRFDDTTLTAIAGMAPGMACECPRHVAELLMQLASFEAYSAGCIDRGPDDAALHAYLQRVAGTARAMFESALARVARHEGLSLP